MVQSNIMQDRLQELFPVHYRNGNILMINADCMKVMKHIQNNEVELSCVDPPYGNKGFDAMHKTSSDSVKLATRGNYKPFENSAPDEKYFSELFRVSKNQIIWGGNFFGLKGGYICWNKHGTCFGEAELAFCSMQKQVNIFDFEWNGMLQGNMKNKESRIHPTQKPVALYKWLLTRYAKPGDRILDTHGGSGSICIACHDLGYDLTWMELDADYYEAACKRYQNHAAQAFLFDPAEQTRDTKEGELF